MLQRKQRCRKRDVQGKGGDKGEVQIGRVKCLGLFAGCASNQFLGWLLNSIDVLCTKYSQLYAGRHEGFDDEWSVLARDGGKWLIIEGGLSHASDTAEGRLAQVPSQR
jgi:hypothetical protein